MDCGFPFVPTRHGQRRCPLHDAPYAEAQASYRSADWRRSRRADLEEGGARCAWCGSTERLVRHHLHPKRDGGSDSDVLLLCPTDHSAYEAAERYDNDTPLRRFVRSAAASRTM